MLVTRVSHEILRPIEPRDVCASDEALAWADVGAWVEFRGLVRRASKGRLVEAMTYDGHPKLIEHAMNEVARDVARQVSQPWKACVHLRLGRLAVGEASVHIATVSAHRAAAYEANRLVLEGLKRWAPIWKCERLVDGTSVWLDGRSLRANVEEATQ